MYQQPNSRLPEQRTDDPGNNSLGLPRTIIRVAICIGCILLILNSLGYIVYSCQSDEFLVLVVLNILIDIVVIIISIIGICAVIYNNQNCFLLFSIALTVCGIIELIESIRLTIIGINSRNENADLFKEIELYPWESRHDFGIERIILLQETEHCCGVYGPDDWKKSRPTDISNETFPLTCCSNTIPFLRHSDGFCTKPGFIYANGCKEKISGEPILFTIFHTILCFLLAAGGYYEYSCFGGSYWSGVINAQGPVNPIVLTNQVPVAYTLVSPRPAYPTQGPINLYPNNPPSNNFQPPRLVPATQPTQNQQQVQNQPAK